MGRRPPPSLDPLCPQGAEDGAPLDMRISSLPSTWVCAVTIPHLLRINSVHTSTNIYEAPTLGPAVLGVAEEGDRACPWEPPTSPGLYFSLVAYASILAPHHPGHMHPTAPCIL